MLVLVPCHFLHKCYFYSVFFFLFDLLFSSLTAASVGLMTKRAHLEFSGFDAARVSHDSPRAQTCTFEGPGASNTTKIPREDPQRGKKRMNFAAGEGKKARNFGPPPFGPPLFLGLVLHPSGPPPFGSPHFGAPPFGAPPFGAPPFGAPPFGPHSLGPKIQHPEIGRSRNWPKSKLAELEKKKSWPKSKLAEVDRAPLFIFTLLVVTLPELLSSFFLLFLHVFSPLLTLYVSSLFLHLLSHVYLFSLMFLLFVFLS